MSLPKHQRKLRRRNESRLVRAIDRLSYLIHLDCLSSQLSIFSYSNVFFTGQYHDDAHVYATIVIDGWWSFGCQSHGDVQPLYAAVYGPYGFPKCINVLPVHGADGVPSLISGTELSKSIPNACLGPRHHNSDTGNCVLFRRCLVPGTCSNSFGAATPSSVVALAVGLSIRPRSQ